MRWRARVVVLAAGLIGAAPASAQNGGGFLTVFGGGGPAPISTVDVPVSATGQLEIDFHGDPQTGCVASGLCDYSGTVIVHPGSGDLIFEKYGHGHSVDYAGLLSLGFEDGYTVAHVDRANGAGMCADEQQTYKSSEVSVRAGIATLSLLQAGGAVVATRCAGPVDGDLAGVAPRLALPIRSLLRGQARLSLSGQASFAAHGFAGTVTSTVTLRLRRAQTQNVSSSSSSSFPPGIKTERVRTVTERLSAVAAHGTLTALVGGTTDATECELLDSCGLAGTLTLSPRFAQISGSLLASGPAKRPYRDFLTALGLARDGNRKGIRVFGDFGWGAGGTVTADLTQSGSCTDEAALGGGQVVLTAQGGKLAAAYAPLLPPRTRCPGPMIGQAQTLAQGDIPLSALRNRTFPLTLSGGPPIQDDGYAGTVRGDFSLTLRRGRISQQVTTQPFGF